MPGFSDHTGVPLEKYLPARGRTQARAVPSVAMSSGTRRQYHRPTLFTSDMIDRYEGGADPARLSEAAHVTAGALVNRGRANGDPVVLEKLIRLADAEGLEEVAELWSASPAQTLPGTLWRLYALRRTVLQDPVRLAAYFRDGRAQAPVHQAIAGVAEPPGPQELVDMTTAILAGAFTGDYDVALHRAAAFCRVVALGETAHADAADHADPQRGSALTRAAHRLGGTADDLDAAAALWRDGDLS